MFDKCYLNCFLYSVCKDQETIAYKVFTKSRACDGVVCLVSSSIHSALWLVLFILYTLLGSNSLDSPRRLRVGGQTKRDQFQSEQNG